MPSEAAVFAALGDETRLALVEQLRTGPASIVSLTGEADMTRQAVTKHLHVLEKAGLVTCTRLGRTTVWQLERLRFDDARHYLDIISRQWDGALERLRVHVEN
ncbi:metalloregulator ArsR/SmtB family transcription factor [Asticcacaulis sp.]|uniref:ArsR/SmtB family transcription factor n=1 Tax=Asticcacaulis sp. TaxID=1872648 RepID=UPI002CC48852|nr:metalloregulator ArsR/SmtB family transcription factor [Asticcacaulis sp.]HTM80646.1 metalloregulator ArsR/SmtB family transcription factor [Asticcacaulis sp.]